MSKKIGQHLHEEFELPSGRKTTYGDFLSVESYIQLEQVVERKKAQQLKGAEEERSILERPLSLGEKQYLDLDTGEYVSITGDGVDHEQLMNPGYSRHLMNKGVDIYMTLGKPFPDGPVIIGIKSLGLAFREAPGLNLQKVSKSAFDELMNPAVRNLAEPQWLTGFSTNNTYAFRTALGKAGVISFSLNNEGAFRPCAVQYILLPEADIPIEKFPWTFGAHRVQSRLRVRKTTWKVEETPFLSLDLRNLSEKAIDFVRFAPLHCEIEIDSRWYGWAKPILFDGPGWVLKPGTELNDAIEIKITDSWALPKEMNTLKHRPGVEEFWGEQLKLTPGKHTVRVRFRPQEWLFGYMKGENDLSIVSNPVEIEILPEEDKPAMQVKNEHEIFRQT